MTVLTNGYPLGEPKSGMEYMYGFADNRPGGVNQVVYDVGRMNQLPGHEPLDDIRHRWRGLRWMNANMLDWKNPNTIMPEELDPPIVSGSTSDENTPPPPQIP